MLSMVTLRLEYRRLNKSLGFFGKVLNSLRWYLVDLKGGRILG
jgi:hypothetical protein